MFRDLKPFPEGDSGTPPAHWRVVPGLGVLRLVNEKNAGLREETVLSLSRGRVVVKPSEKLHGLVPASFESYQRLRPGNIVIRPTDLQNDQTSVRVGFVRDRGIITSAYLGFDVRTGALPEFAYLHLATLDAQKVFYGMGSGLRQNLDWSDFKRLPIALPPAEEQAAIVKYLGHAHRRIDRAIAAKRKMIALLEEQKRAILSHAVTRGLDPTVPMKDSGIPWLGQVPAHWDAVPLKRVARLRGGTGFPVERQGRAGEPLPFFRVSDMSAPGHEVWMGVCDSTVSYREAREMGAPVFRDGAILFPKVGGALLTNKRRIAAVPCCLDNNLMGAEFFGLEDTYGYLVMTLVDLTVVAKPGPVPAVGQGDVGAIVVPVPPVAEQEAIVRHVERESSSLRSALQVAGRAVQLLREFRIRLASDVVTGQLDVRHIAARLPEFGSDELAQGVGNSDDDLGDEVAEFMKDVET